VTQTREQKRALWVAQKRWARLTYGRLTDERLAAMRAWLAERRRQAAVRDEIPGRATRRKVTG
jgi:hypothetical protein